MIANLLSALAAGPQRLLRRMLARAVLALVSAVLALVGLGFATSALYIAWRSQYGAIDAAIWLAAIYFVAAGLFYLCRAALKPEPASAPKLVKKGAGGPQAQALELGVDLAKQLTPLQIVLLGALAGFVAARRL